MEVYSSGEGGGGVRLLRYAPSGQLRPAEAAAAAARKQDTSKAFPFRFRRRSKSAPRNKRSSGTDNKPPALSTTSGGFITYSANGEKIRSNKESPSKPDKVELVGFTSYRGEDRRGGGAPGDDDSESAYCSLSESLKSHESRTSSNIKMERDRLRRERLNSSGLGGGLRPWASTSATASAHAPLVEHQKISAATRLLSAAASEREKFFEEARERFFAQTAAVAANSSSSSSSSDLFNQFLREREERLARLTAGSSSISCYQPAAFLLPRPRDSPLFSRRLTTATGPTSVRVVVGTSQLTGAVGTSAADSSDYAAQGAAVGDSGGLGEGRSGVNNDELALVSGETKTVNCQQLGENSDDGADMATAPEGSRKGRERVIPIQILSEPMLPQLNLRYQNVEPSTHAQDSDTVVTMTAVNIDRRRQPPPLLQSLLADVRAASGGVGDPSSMGSFATALGFGARFINGSLNSDTSDSDDPAVQLRPSAAGASAASLRESFPGFPSFGNFPSFAVPLLLPGDRLNLSPRTRNRQLSQKIRLAKSKSAADCATDGFR